jgi:hypothetical protein
MSRLLTRALDLGQRLLDAGQEPPHRLDRGAATFLERLDHILGELRCALACPGSVRAR